MVIVPLTFYFWQLHFVIQAAFNWWNYHLREFNIGGLSYGAYAQVGEPDHDDDRRFFDEAKVRLLDFNRWTGVRFLYIHDFDDNWHHIIDLEDMLVLDPAPSLASCIDGARARPPEDVGGTPGYENFLAIMDDCKYPKHAETKRWCGGTSIRNGSISPWSTRTSVKP